MLRLNSPPFLSCWLKAGTPELHEESWEEGEGLLLPGVFPGGSFRARFTFPPWTPEERKAHLFLIPVIRFLSRTATALSP